MLRKYLLVRTTRLALPSSFYRGWKRSKRFAIGCIADCTVVVSALLPRFNRWDLLWFRRLVWFKCGYFDIIILLLLVPTLGEFVSTLRMHTHRSILYTIPFELFNCRSEHMHVTPVDNSFELFISSDFIVVSHDVMEDILSLVSIFHF